MSSTEYDASKNYSLPRERVYQLLPSNDREIYKHRLMGGIYEVSGLSALIPRIIKTCACSQKLIGEDAHAHTESATSSRTPIFIFENKENRLKTQS
jgi:hypothetical protein